MHNFGHLDGSILIFFDAPFLLNGHHEIIIIWSSGRNLSIMLFELIFADLAIDKLTGAGNALDFINLRLIQKA